MKTLAKKLKKVFEKNKKEILDIILFGSFVKGRLSPRDVDIAVLDMGVDRSFLKKQILTVIPKADIQFVRFQDYDKSIWLTLLREGYSVRDESYLYQSYGVQPSVLYTYSLQSLSASKKVMFARAIKKFKGMERLSNHVVLVPMSLSCEFADFLLHWNIDIDAKEYALLPLLRKEAF